MALWILLGILTLIMEDQESVNTIVAVVHKKLLISFMEVLLKTPKCPLIDVHNKLDLDNRIFVA